MRKTKGAFLTVVAVLFAPMAANADLLSFSYLFSDSSVLSGILDGTVQGDGDTVFINGFGDVSYDGNALNSIEAGDIRSISDFRTGALQALVSFSGAAMDVFVCALGFAADGNCDFTTDGGFFFANPHITLVDNDVSVDLGATAGAIGGVFHIDARFNPDNWRLVMADVPESVPEPGTRALLGLGLAGLGLRSRRKKV